MTELRIVLTGLLLGFCVACDSKQPEPWPVQSRTPVQTILFKEEMQPGEMKRLDVEAESDVWVGIMCDDVASNGSVALQQVGEDDRIATIDWTSRVWRPVNGVVQLEVLNQANRPKTVTVFRGESPP